MTTFTTRIAGIPCQIQINHFQPAVPMQVFGIGWEDAYPAEPAEIELEVLDRKGYKAPWLANKLTEEDMDRLMEEAEAACLAEAYGIEF